MRYAMIMAGGAGTRLWPMSRKALPKQLLRFIDVPGSDEPRSLLEVSAARLEGLVPPDRRYICTGESFRSLIRDALPEFSDQQILGEPVGRDTVNAVGFGAAVFEKIDPDATFVVLTADHLIRPEDEFRRLIDVGFRLVEDDPSRLVTFSIKPTFPATGFGYVERGSPIHGIEGGDGLAFRVARFVEKPTLQHAQAYVESGMFGWNSGMFVWKASTVMDCLRRFKPESHEGLKRIQDAWGTDAQNQVLEDVYPTLPKTSVDYAIMEPASSDKEVTVCTVSMDLDWLDVGSWPSYGETLEPDETGNRSAGFAPSRAVVHDGTDNLLVSNDPDHTVALLGCEGLIVIHTPEATLVMPRDKAQDLKNLHALVRDELK